MSKKWHTCEEDGAHLRISFLHLLINLKNNYLFKKLLSGLIKKVRILIFTMLHFPKKIKKNTWRYNYLTPVYQKSRYDLQFLRYWAWQSEIGNFESFFALLHPWKPEKSEFSKNEKKKKNAGYIIILHICTKNHNHMMYVSWDIVCNRHNFFGHFESLFALSPTPLWPRKLKFGKK